jgi:hypothetical protein
MEDIEDMFKGEDAAQDERIPQSKRKIVKKVAPKKPKVNNEDNKEQETSELIDNKENINT